MPCLAVILGTVAFMTARPSRYAQAQWNMTITPTWPLLRVLLPAATLAFATACDRSSSPASDWTITVDSTAGGITRVVNEPPSSGIEPRWIIEPDLTIGSVEGDPAEIFGTVKGVAPLHDGRIAVLDGQAQEIRVFSPDGQYLRTIARRGSGPGELQDANGMLVGPDGLLRVNDPRNSRLSLFDADSGYVGSERLQVSSWGFIWNASIGRDGRIFETTTTQLDSESWVVIKVYDSAGSWVDTVRLNRFEPSDGGTPAVFSFETASTSGFMAVPYYPAGVQVLDPDGGFWRKGEGDNSYRFVRTTFNGDTLLVVENRRTPLPVSAAERDSTIGVISERVPGYRFDWSRIPDEKPVVQGMLLDDSGRLWVRVFASDSAITYDVYDRTGRYEGTAVTSLRFTPYWRPLIVGDRFYTLHTDEMDVPYVVRARIREVGGEG